MYIQTKIQKQSSNWLHNSFDLHRGMFVTIHYTDKLGFDRGFNTRLLLEKVNKRLLRKLEKKLGFNDRQRLERLVFIEKGRSRNHTHMMVETPIHVSNQRMIETLRLESLAHILGPLEFRELNIAPSLSFIVPHPLAGIQIVIFEKRDYLIRVFLFDVKLQKCFRPLNEVLPN